MADVRIIIKVISDAATASVKKLGAQAKKANKNLKSINVSVKNTTSALKVFAGNIGAIAVAKLAGALVSLGSSFIKAATDLETITTQFEILTGSAGNANKAIRDLQNFAATTPFQFTQLAQASAKLQGFGLSADEAQEKLQVLGDVAAASGTDIQSISLIFGQVSAAGKLTGERLLQLQERAIPIGPAIAKTMGIAESAVRDAVSSGKVDFATFEKAFESLGETGAFAFEGMIKLSQTLSGRVSTLKDNFDLLSTDIGASLTPALKTLATSLTLVIQNIRKSEAFAGFLKDVMAAIPAVIRNLGNTFIFFNNVIAESRIFINNLRIGFNAIAEGAVGTTVAMLEAARATQEFLGLDTSTLDSSIITLTILQETFEEVGVEAAEANFKIEASQIATNKVIDETTTSTIKLYNDEIAATEAKANATVTSNKKTVESEQEKFTLLQLIEQEKAQAKIDQDAQNAAAEELKGSEDFERLQRGLGEQEAAKVVARAKELENQGKHDQALKVLAEASEKADKRIKKKKKENSDREEADRKSSLNTIATLSQSNNKTLAAIGKAAALTQIAISGPAAVVKAFEAFPPPFSFVAAAAVGAAVAAQAAKVAGISFADGGIVPGSSFSGDRVAANVNSGEMILNRQQQTTLLGLASGSGGAGGQPITVNTTVELDGEVVGRSVSRQVANGLVLGEFD